MNNKLKIWELSLLIALCVSLLAGTWAQAQQNEISSGLVRLHVIADSDDKAEQELKLRVRDEVLDYLEPLLRDAGSPEAAQSIITAHLDGITLAAQSVSEGRKVQVKLGEEYYPTRDYGDFSLPAGRYTSLRVILGSGNGHNWWCVVFPPLCVSAAERTAALDTMSDNVRGIIDGSSDSPAIRFRILELWGEFLEIIGAG